MEDITDADYMHAKRDCKDFEIKKSGEYYDLYLKSDTLIMADVFEDFRKMRLEIYQLDPAKVFSFWISSASSCKKNLHKLEKLTDSDMLLMVENETRDGKDYDKSKGSPYLKYWYVNNLYDWAMF